MDNQSQKENQNSPGASSVLPAREEMMRFMTEAMKEAEAGISEGGIPIGSVLVRHGVIIGRGHNRRVQQGDPTAHAEIDCFKNAGRIGSYKDTILYSTLMPCSMCAGAAVLFRMPLVVAGEDRTFQSSRDFMESNGITVVDLDLDECFPMLENYASEHPDIWNEDIGITD
jgi:cytosine/creatinine deaminase